MKAAEVVIELTEKLAENLVSRSDGFWRETGLVIRHHVGAANKFAGLSDERTVRRNLEGNTRSARVSDCAKIDGLRRNGKSSFLSRGGRI